ncbi:hypothetical protein V498_06505, partial [Pseudogymnoascus sp. VKM F-4517 (FW-2822)]
ILAESKNPFLDHEESGEDGEWDGIKEEAPAEPIDHEEEYIDEDRFTTVTVEEVGVTKDGLHTAAEDEELELEAKKKADAAAKAAKEAKANPKKQWPKKEKKKPFRSRGEEEGRSGGQSGEGSKGKSQEAVAEEGEEEAVQEEAHPPQTAVTGTSKTDSRRDISGMRNNGVNRLVITAQTEIAM